MKREMKELQDQLTTATAPLEKWYVFCPIALTPTCAISAYHH
jgi:hypothetical protein